MAKRIRWTEDMIVTKLQEHADRLGRMPSARELRREGANALAIQVGRRGGFREWATRLGLALKDSATKRGNDWEDHEEAFWRELGATVERQTTCAPFDLQVNAHRVDVKHATWGDYPHGKYRVRGFVFAGLKRGIDCDVFDLLCIRGEADPFVAHRFIIPSSVANVTTLTITQRQLDGAGKYSEWLDRTDLLL